MAKKSNIYNYIDKYGDVTFKEKEFNELDAIILSCITYVEFDNIINNSFESVKLSEAAKKVNTVLNEKIYKKRASTVKESFKLLQVIKSKKRYKNIELYNYLHKVTFEEQFGALTMRLDEDTIFVGFEGTDHNIVGWYEDAALSYVFPVPAQRDAIRYINKTILFSDKNVYIGGHSKGGHLALVASMYTNILLRHKIVAIYSFDGPGLRKKQYESIKYKKILPKYHHIIPQYSVFGVLLRHNTDYKIVKANKLGFYAHSPFTWEINDDYLVEEKINKISKKLEESNVKWLDSHNDIQRKRVIEALFNIFKTSNIKSTNDLPNLKNLLILIRNSKALDEETKKILKEYITFNINYLTKKEKGEVNE